jgi:hypothetical protein
MDAVLVKPVRGKEMESVVMPLMQRTHGSRE